MTRTDTAAGLERFSLSGRISLITGATRGLGLEIARGMAARGRGRLVFISSMVGPQSFQGDPAYVASKGGLES
jgi:NAD(P)-dependent dehydrogenase (short-subunit alcohol dehydrogenase family)